MILASLNLAKDIAGIGIRSKGVLIKREFFNLQDRHSSAVNRLTGEVNVDFLPITTSRSDFLKDTDAYKAFYQVMEKKLHRVIREIEKSSVSYSDRKAEKTLSDALDMIRHALRKNSDIFLPGEMPLFATKKQQKKHVENLGATVIVKAMVKKKSKQNQFQDTELKSIIKQAVAKLRPKVRRTVRTVLRDERRIIKKIKVGGAEFLVSFAHLGKDENESFSEGGIIFINRDHRLFTKVGKKVELTFYHLIRLVTQELIKLASPRNLDIAYDWQGKLIADAFLKMKEEKNENTVVKKKN